MNLDELRSAQAKERRKDSLQHLRDSFYDDVAAYVADLRAARDRRADQVDKPFSDDDVRRMSDEVETAEEVAEALYERRVGKVVKLASFAAADMPVEDEGMTTEERELFDDLVDRIGENKSRVLDVLSGEASPSGSGEASPSRSGEASPSRSGEASPSRLGEASPSRSDEASQPDPDAAVSPASEPPVAAGDESTPGSAAESDAAPATPEVATDSDALAGAMGGSESDATAVEPVDEVDGAVASAERTEVPPEPAPPGASGAEDAESRPPAAGASGGDTRRDPERRGDGGVTRRGEKAEHLDTDDPPGRDERTTVKITRDVGAILGVDDREYELASEDVVTLPAENADPLLQRDAAERLD